MGNKKPMKSSKKKTVPAKKKLVVKKSATKKPAVKMSAAKKPAIKKSVKAKPKSKLSAKQVSKKPAVKKAVPTKKITPTKKLTVKPSKAAIPSKLTKPVKLTDYSKAFTPLADRLVVRVTESEKITAGGIIIPDSASAVVGHLKGEVLAVGGGAKNKKGQVRPLDVRLGDYVLFAQYSGTKIEFNAEELQIVKESDVMGIVQK